MAAEADYEELMRMQQEMVELMGSLAGETDVERIQQVAAQLTEMAEALQEKARVFEIANTPERETPKTQVLLTEAQQKRIKDETGVEMELLILKDPAGITSRVMPATPPQVIEAWAIAEAKRRKLAEESDAQVDEEIERVVTELQEKGGPAVLDKLEELKQDPNFLAGKLAKKEE